MKRALQGILVATEKMRDDTLNGKKKITIREGHRDYTVGPVLIGCHILNWATLKKITSIRYTSLKEVTVEEWTDDNYKDQNDLFNGVKSFYPDITWDSPITVIRWDDLDA